MKTIIKIEFPRTTYLTLLAAEKAGQTEEFTSEDYHFEINKPWGFLCNEDERDIEAE